MNITVNPPNPLTDPRRMRTEWRKPVVANNFTSGSEVLLLDTAPSGVAKLTITNGGSGYTSAPTVGFTGGGGTGFTAFAEISAGAVVQVTITAAGTGFTSAPTVTFTGGGGTLAAATATLGAPSPGNIERLQIAVLNNGGGLTNLTSYGSRLNIYVDGEGTAGLQIPLGDLFCHRFVDGTQGSPQRVFSAGRIDLTEAANALVSGSRYLFAPFTTSVKVTLTNYQVGVINSARDCQLFTQVDYRLGSIPNWRGGPGTRRAKLRQAIWNAGYTGGTTDGYNAVTAASINVLANVSSVRGELESIHLSMLNNGGTAQQFLEGHVKMFADGVLDSESGGTEDFFFNQFYGGNHVCNQFGGMPSSDIIEFVSWYAASGYRLFGDPPHHFTFDNGFEVTWQAGLPWSNSGAVNALADVLYWTDH